MILNDPWYWVGHVAPGPNPVCGTESKSRWTGVGTMVGKMDLLILGTYGVAGSSVIQAREVCDPTPAIGSG